MNSSNLVQVNSNSYVDLLGIQLGMSRFQGETSSAFLDRMFIAASNPRGKSYRGIVDQITSQLGLSTRPVISILPVNPNDSLVITCGTGILSISSSSNTATIPFVNLTNDCYWSWINLSDLVNFINSTGFATATLLGEDASCIYLARQTSLHLVVGEAVTGVQQFLAHSGVQVGSEKFNISVPTYNLLPSGNLTFTSSPVANTTVSYVYNIPNFQLVSSDVKLISLLDSDITQIATNDGINVAYQLREFTQNVLQQDPSYWGE